MGVGVVDDTKVPFDVKENDDADGDVVTNTTTYILDSGEDGKHDNKNGKFEELKKEQMKEIQGIEAGSGKREILASNVIIVSSGRSIDGDITNDINDDRNDDNNNIENTKINANAIVGGATSEVSTPVVPLVSLSKDDIKTQNVSEVTTSISRVQWWKTALAGGEGWNPPLLPRQWMALLRP